jgi:hypothetical protein
MCLIQFAQDVEGKGSVSQPFAQPFSHRSSSDNNNDLVVYKTDAPISKVSFEASVAERKRPTYGYGTRASTRTRVCHFFYSHMQPSPHVTYQWLTYGYGYVCMVDYNSVHRQWHSQQ